MDPATDNNNTPGTPSEAPPVFAPLMRVVSPLDIPHSDFVGGLERRTQNRHAFLQWVETHLRDGVDYGRIHVVKRSQCNDSACTYARNPRHWSKANMFKPGAEKVTGALGIRVTFPAFKDYERAALDGHAITQIVLRCRLEDGNGNCFAEGIGARSVEDDYGDVNKALKMAAKSAQVDGVLRIGGLSENFTQGLEDMPAAKLSELADHPEESAHPPWPSQQEIRASADTPAPEAPRVPPPAQARPRGAPISEGQVRLLHVKLDRAGVPERELLAKYGLGTLEEMPRSTMDAALAWLASFGG